MHLDELSKLQIKILELEKTIELQEKINELEREIHKNIYTSIDNFLEDNPNANAKSVKSVISNQLDIYTKKIKLSMQKIQETK
ncbi:hypothetical protein [Laribacter hongkongensis]|uniref:hypothetical protein n=1 Tax=Laribacter hongkongensis TaxID=168471 RepID=UPI001EFD691E|nr:hypothetical protein [Laribacter hongkongensis]MCG9096411.1 hypothetical protein [Laribacter hongkongensis]MCG9125922.1 hypothetical protein [Laribacter hongkongensis]